MASICSNASFGAYFGSVTFVPSSISDSNLSIQINLACSSAQTKLGIFPSPKDIYLSAGASVSDSVLVCNNTSKDFSEIEFSIEGQVEPYIVGSFSGSLPASTCRSIVLNVNAPLSSGSLSGTLTISSGDFSSSEALNLIVS